MFLALGSGFLFLSLFFSRISQLFFCSSVSSPDRTPCFILQLYPLVSSCHFPLPINLCTQCSVSLLCSCAPPQPDIPPAPVQHQSCQHISPAFIHKSRVLLCHFPRSLCVPNLFLVVFWFCPQFLYNFCISLCRPSCWLLFSLQRAGLCVLCYRFWRCGSQTIQRVNFKTF